MKFVILTSILILCSSCASLEKKAFASASGVEAVKIETTGGVTTGTVLPNLIIGGAVSSIATSPAVKAGSTTAPVIAFSRRTSLLASIFGLDCSTETLVYIGVAGETSAETVNRITSALSTIKKENKKTEESSK